MREYYIQIEQIKNDKVVGRSFRVLSLWFWQSLTKELNEMLCLIEDTNNIDVAYVIKIKKL